MATVADRILFIITGDNSGLKRAAAETDSTINKMTTNANANLKNLLLGFLGVAGGIAAVTTALKFAVGQALESERAYNALAVAIDTAGDSWAAQEKTVRAFLTTFQETTRFTDEEGARALQILIQSGMGVQQAMSLMTVAADAAVATQHSLTDAADLLALAFQGNARGAQQFGIRLSETGDAAKILNELVGKMQDRFSGQAQKDLQTSIGQWESLKKEWGELAETLGKALLPGLSGLLQSLNEITSADLWRRKPDPNSIMGLIFNRLGFTGLATGQFIKSGLENQFFGPPRPPSAGVSPITTPSKDVIKKQAEERAKIEQDAREKSESEIGAYTEKVHTAVWENFKKQLQDAHEKRLQAIDDEEHAQKLAFQSIIGSAHQLAFEFSRVMSEAVSNFVHNSIQGIADIRANVLSIRNPETSGLGRIASGVGIFGSVVGIIGSFADAIFGGSEKIFKSNVEVVKAIQNWITNLRGQTKEELIAGKKDIEAGRKTLAEFRALDAELLKKNSDEFVASLADSEFKQTFAAAAEQFKRSTGRRGSVEEVLFFMEQQLKKQEQLFDALVGGKVKSPDDVRKLLSEQTRLDAQTGRQWIEFIARQNNWTPAEQKALFEELFTTLSNSGNASVAELMALRETITALEEGTAAEQGQQLQITRSVASITEGQANLVVGHLQTISSTAQMILEAIQNAINNFVSAASGIPAASGATFGPGSIVINAGPGASPEAISQQLQTDLRAKGVKV